MQTHQKYLVFSGFQFFISLRLYFGSVWIWIPWLKVLIVNGSYDVYIVFYLLLS